MRKKIMSVFIAAAVAFALIPSIGVSAAADGEYHVGKGGGFIVAPTHSIPNDVPTENILAFLDAVQNQ